MATILVVDDDRISRRVLGYTLKQNGHVVEPAEHGGHALERLAEQSFDLVIADLSMPVMDGLTLLQRLRADDRYKQLPVIMLTASGQDEAYAAAGVAGASDCLTKPVGSRELVDVVARLLR
jgi:CheY-like chemotaxis protein